MNVFHVLLAGKSAFLPMDRYEAEKFLYDLGLDLPGTEYEVHIDPYHGYPIETASDFRELNRLAHRIDQMDDYQRATFTAWCETQDPCTVGDALRASNNLNRIEFHPGFDSDELLGNFALESELFEEYNGLPDEVYNMLDRAKVGAQMREMQGGVFAEGGYLVPEPMEGLDYPPEEPLPWFQVSFSDGWVRESDWDPLPMTAEDEKEIAGYFETDSLDGLHMVCRSSLPQLDGLVAAAEELPELREMSEVLTGMDSEEIQKYKALLEVLKPESISEALRLADGMDQHRIEPGYADPATYGRKCATGLTEDHPLREFIDYAGYGAAMLREHGFTATRYGAVMLGPQVEQAQAEQHSRSANEIYSGQDFQCNATDGFPTVLCYDLVNNQAWLEPAPAFDDEDDPLCQECMEACRAWGQRPCESWEDYNYLLERIGEEAYENAAVEIEDQGMGGMGAMV